MSFTNIYYKRAVGTPKACFVCYRPTTIVLATKDTVDFIYTCASHLTDPGFATLAEGGGSNARKVSEEEIAKVKAEWEEAQKKKKEKAKEKEKDKDKDTSDSKDKEKVAEKAKEAGKDSEDDLKNLKMPGALFSPPATPSHEKYTLHRDFFAMRQDLHRKRKQSTQAKQVAPRLPSAPRIGIPDN